MIRIIKGDCRDRLRDLPDESVHCVVTSPPYFGLRDYGTAQWDGGDSNCDHIERASRADAGRPTCSPRPCVDGKPNESLQQFRSHCQKCGARRIDSQIGLEKTPQDYVEQMVAVFREVRRVLRKDGTVWLNLGDSYAATTNGNGGHNPKQDSNTGSWMADRKWRITDGLKPKDLIGIPWRVAFALQADGWWLRQDIIWAKPNPMPESVTDRCTKAHEYMFLMSKSERYFYDADAIREPFAYAGDIRINTAYAAATGKQPTREYRALLDTNGRNKRSVWEIATAPFSEAHFATFPPALIEPCIMAGCPDKVCSRCGDPWIRNVERVDTGKRQKMADGWDTGEGAHGTIHRNGRERGKIDMPVMATITNGFSPSCSCDAAAIPGTVLDPFGGAGTTGLVADRLGRNAILIELNPDYAGMAERRIADDAGMFADMVAE